MLLSSYYAPRRYQGSFSSVSAARTRAAPRRCGMLRPRSMLLGYMKDLLAVLMVLSLCSGSVNAGVCYHRCVLLARSTLLGSIVALLRLC
jgi:hypothetical protein